MKLSEWTRPLHYKGNPEIERKAYGPNQMDELYWPVDTNYDEETDVTTVKFALVMPE